MKKSILFLILLIVFLFQFVFTQTMKVNTKTGSTSYKLSDIDSITFLQSGGTVTGTVTDADGNVYKTVTIGTQVWMAENLKTTKYGNGDAIPNVTDDNAWMMLTAQVGAVGATGTGGYCNYDNSTSNGATYGRLYNGWAVSDSRKLAPLGWHVATDAEWTTLITYVGADPGKKLKEAGTVHWNSQNIGTTNETGFTALGGGSRTGNGGFYYILNNATWWTSSEFAINGAKVAWLWQLFGMSFGADRQWNNYGYGCSVRCIKD